MSDYDSYINTIDVIEDGVIDDTKFPIVKDNKLKQIFRVMLEFLKVIINYLKYYIDATKEKQYQRSVVIPRSKPIPEDFELSDEEPAVVNLNEEQKLTSKQHLSPLNVPMCNGCNLQMRNEISIDPKGIKCSCNPCSFKLSRNDKTMNVSRDDNGR